MIALTRTRKAARLFLDESVGRYRRRSYPGEENPLLKTSQRAPESRRLWHQKKMEELLRAYVHVIGNATLSVNPACRITATEGVFVLELSKRERLSVCQTMRSSSRSMA